MNRKNSIRFLSGLLLVLFCLSLILGGVVVQATNESVAFPRIHSERVVTPEIGDALVVNDTIEFSADPGEIVKSMDAFSIGFPTDYRQNLIYYFAQDTEGKLQTTFVPSGANELDWIVVSFGQNRDVSGGGSYKFSVISVFSGQIEVGNKLTFRADFPLVPGLPVNAEICNVTFRLPVGANFTSSSRTFSNNTVDSQLILYTNVSPLKAGMTIPSWVNFTSPAFVLLDVNKLERGIHIDPLGKVTIEDHYTISNLRGNANIKLILPSNATNISVKDIYGAYGIDKMNVTDETEYTQVALSIRNALTSEREFELLVVCELPFWEYSAQTDWQNYKLNASLSRPTWILKNFTIEIFLPEGGVFESSTLETEMKTDFLTETLIHSEYDVTRFHPSSFEVSYRYSILWATFRPTLWTATAIFLLSIIYMTVRVSSKQSPTPIVSQLSTDLLRRFVEIYDERRRLMTERDDLSERMRKGKISRRQHRLRRSSLDARFSRQQRDSIAIRREIQTSGGRYADYMKRLEMAETRIETLDRDIERLEAQYQRKQVSADVHKKLLDEYGAGKRSAESTLDEIILRIREEIR